MTDVLRRPECTALVNCVHEEHNHQNHDHEHHHHSNSKSSSSSISSKYLVSYEINDEQHNTQVTVLVSGDTRTITSNALPNHATGQFPNKGNSNTISAQSRKWVLPLTPEFTGEYHYHGVSQNLVDFSDQGNDLVHIGFAADGFLIMYSKGDVYKPSYQLKTEPRTGTNCVYRNPYTNQKIDIDGTVSDGTYVSDWEFVEGVDDLDSCDGISVDGQYVYIASEQYPYIGRCVNGKVTSQKKGKRRGPPPGGDHSGRRLPPPNRS